MIVSRLMSGSTLAESLLVPLRRRMEQTSGLRSLLGPSESIAEEVRELDL